MHAANAPGDVGMLPAAGVMAIIFGGLAGGALVDRFGVRSIGLLGTDFAASGLLLLGLMMHAQTAPLPAIILVAALIHAPEGSAAPVFFARMPELAENAGVDLAGANAASDLLDGLAVIIGAPLADTLVTSGRPEARVLVAFGLRRILRFSGLAQDAVEVLRGAGNLIHLGDPFPRIMLYRSSAVSII